MCEIELFKVGKNHSMHDELQNKTLDSIVSSLESTIWTISVGRVIFCPVNTTVNDQNNNMCNFCFRQ